MAAGLDSIVIKGAREHNLKNVDLTLPRNRLIVVTGLSGSGKSSLAFDTIYAEGQRRYVESLSSYARQFLGSDGEARRRLHRGAFAGDLDRSEVDLAQSALDGRHGHRDLRLPAPAFRAHRQAALLSSAGAKSARSRASRSSIRSWSLPEGTRIQLLAPVIRGRKGEYAKLFEEIGKEGFARVRVDGEINELRDKIDLDKKRKHTIEVVVDRLVMKPDIRKRLTDSVETTLRLSTGIVTVLRTNAKPAKVDGNARSKS